MAMLQAAISSSTISTATPKAGPFSESKFRIAVAGLMG